MMPAQDYPGGGMGGAPVGQPMPMGMAPMGQPMGMVPMGQQPGMVPVGQPVVMVPQGGVVQGQYAAGGGQYGGAHVHVSRDSLTPIPIEGKLKTAIILRFVAAAVYGLGFVLVLAFTAASLWGWGGGITYVAVVGLIISAVLGVAYGMIPIMSNITRNPVFMYRIDPIATIVHIIWTACATVWFGIDVIVVFAWCISWLSFGTFVTMWLIWIFLAAAAIVALIPLIISYVMTFQVQRERKFGAGGSGVGGVKTSAGVMGGSGAAPAGATNADGVPVQGGAQF